MLRMARITAILLLLGLFFSFKTSAQGPCCITLPAEKLIVLAVDKAKQNDRLKQEKLTYVEHYTRNEFNFKMEPKSTERSTTTLSGQARKLAGFNLEIGGLLDMLRNRHEFSFAGQKDVIFDGNGRPSLVLEFRPKDDLQYPTTEDKFINRLQGRIIIDAEDQTLWQVEASIPETNSFNFRVWWKILFATVDVQYFKLDFEQTKFGDIIVEKTINVETKFRVLGSTRTRKYIYEYGNYRVK
jgi:hypothetical protein